MTTEKLEKEEKAEEHKKREIAIPGEIIVSGKDYLPGEGTRREGDNIIANKFGLIDVSGRLVKIIQLSGVYIPRAGNIVLGKIEDVTFNGWLVDLRAPYSSFLPVSEYPRYIRGDLAEFLNIGDIIVCGIDSVKRKGIDLTLKERGFGKLENGITITINPHKVPRVIGKEGSMIKLIKQETGCEIVVGQNGVIWIAGNKVEEELKAKQAIMFITEKSYIEGLTEKVKEWFDGKIKEKKE